MLEQDIHRAVWKHIQARLVREAFAFHVPNGGARSKVEAAIFASLGVVPGIPDLIAICRGQTFGLELKRAKTDGGRLTAKQIEVHQRLREAGAIVATAYGLGDAIRQLEDWKLLRGNMTPS
jgi:hypothetical protein